MLRGPLCQFQPFRFPLLSPTPLLCNALIFSCHHHPPSSPLYRQCVPVAIDPACAKELRSVKARMEALEARARVRAHADL